MNQIHVVFGAAGALGAAVVRRLIVEGKPARAVVRNIDRARQVIAESAEIVSGDATSVESVRTACHDAVTIYHCVNVPYPRWTAVMPSATENILAGAKKAKASIVFPGNVYSYGPFQKIPATEDHPLAARSKKGQRRFPAQVCSARSKQVYLQQIPLYEGD